ncbi:MAG TPA: FdrA family protein [Streptosporangiaceae bacterium]|nr:FdrA family protein [Streptosporangiaceae bacterium]
MSAEQVQARPGAYADSVTLMQVSAKAQAASGVRVAMIAMATELNLALLAELGMTAPPGASQHDLLVAIRATDDESLNAALELVDAALAGRSATSEQPAGQGVAPRTTSTAIARSGAGIALVSVPGQYAFAEAMDALRRGCDVMIFSDNMPVEQEVALKEIAAERGLLVMGPDCGTAIVAGIGLGFANSVRQGPVGVVAASGTGAQQIACLLDAAGVGCSAVLGLGGRDLSAAVGGRSARAALAALDADPATDLIVLLSKPPATEVAAALRDYAATLTKPVNFALIGPGQPDLTSAAESALRSLGNPIPDWPRWSPGAERRLEPREQCLGGERGTLSGLFSGGTLCDEAMVIAAERLGPIYSNIPLDPAHRLDPLVGATQARHTMIDFGADELTVGRPHPMIDQRLRLDHFAAEVADPATAVIMLDVVLGYGSHPDPAAEIAPIVAAAKSARDIEVVISLIGSEADPQGLAAQAAALSQAGAHVFASNAQAARFACDLLGTTRAANVQGGEQA